MVINIILFDDIIYDKIINVNFFVEILTIINNIFRASGHFAELS